MKAKLTILGCGNSSGVPAAGNHWGACDKNEPKNTRTRCSIALQTASTTLIIDTGPDFRDQTIRENIQSLDAVLYSHHHSDHVNGIDDLRGFAFRSKSQVPVYGARETLEAMEGYFPYAFRGGDHEIYPPTLKPHIFDPQAFGTQQSIGDIAVTPLQMDHGSCMATGYRFGDTAYCVDMLQLDDAAIQTLQGIKTWIVDAAAYHSDTPKVHANLDTIYALNKQIGAAQVYLTSLSLMMDYKTMCAELPDGYAPCYDGMVLAVNLDVDERLNP